MTLKSVHTLLDVLHFADSHTAIIVPELGIRVTYDSLRQQVLAMANALASAGIRRGDAVAIALPNGLPAIVSFLAASIAGTAAPLNPAYPYEEFHFFLGDTNARILLCPAGGAEFVRSAAADRKIPVLSVEMSDQGNVHLLDAATGVFATEAVAAVGTGRVGVGPHKFDALCVWRKVREHGVTWSSGVPPIPEMVLARAHH